MKQGTFLAGVGFLLVFLVGCVCGEDALTWKSAFAKKDLPVKVTKPAVMTPAGGYPAVIFVQGIPGIDATGFEKSRDELLAQGFVVGVVDYHGADFDVDTSGPNLGALFTPGLMAKDILKLRADLTEAKSWFKLIPEKIDPAHVFILPAGYRLKRDVEFARTDKRVLAMDIAYPATSKTKSPMLMEFSCDNDKRMGSGSLLFCRDALLEVGALDGYIVAMADHPVAPPFKGIDDPFPQTLDFARQAVSKLRSLNDELGGNGKVGAIGFSRGSTYAAMLAADGTVDRALVHGNRFDYTRLRADDKMAARFAKAWGPLETSREKWEQHGAFHYLNEKCSPMYLNTSDKESPEYRDGLEQLHVKLTEMKVPHEYQVDTDGRGHQVSQDPQRLKSIFEFFGEMKK